MTTPPNRWTREKVVIECTAWLVALGFLVAFACAATILDQFAAAVPSVSSVPSSAAAKPVPRWSPLIPRREEEANAPEDGLDDTDLAVPGQYAANHSITNAP